MILLLAVVHGVGSYPNKRNPVSQPKLKTPEGHDSRRRSSIVVIPETVEDLQQNPGISDLDIFKYEEMKMATKHFRPKQVLGEGGFGIVYKGVIDEHVRPGYKTTYVAIKELDPEGLQGDREWLVGALASCLVNNLIIYLPLDSESLASLSPLPSSSSSQPCPRSKFQGQIPYSHFISKLEHKISLIAEMNYLGQLRHPNLVKLIGYCCEDHHRLLVYEYMESGSLEKHLFPRMCATLTWSRRMKVALDAAKGLAFLHGAEMPVIYRDFKTSNILLDADFNAKLSDFGLAKDGPMGDQTHVSTRVMGTYGYAAPEYVMTGHLTARSDVYAYGVVLLEMLIGRRAIDKTRPSQEYNLVEWARPLLNHNKKLFKILDPRLKGQYSSKTVVKVASLAYQCLSQNPKGRPVMSQVVEILEALQVPQVKD
ncbi:hypothetical protein KY290_011470 [Solanum tuberosum]|uniref:Protein kinase domain-containing protein n=1 Tax=Solanum tuberosum TaxID=4113 RepID=A0ABQ7W0R7_SOLTU|nr:hypothetical protein KY284_011576 [Solanum tuberosum]KAH0774333.1 hypothetical protein KY290_011470 [Solanum tuberosum]